ncbi:ATP-binding protein, partial [Arthrospira platensis SPKY2]
LDYMGLDASMRWHAETQCARAGLILSYVSELGDQRFDSRTEIVVFRLMQEALTNVIRHAQAKEVSIDIVVDPEALEMTVVDDGNGFDVELARRRMLLGQSTGLLGMEERARLVDGALDIVSETGGGTTVRVRLPIKESSQP